MKKIRFIKAVAVKHDIKNVDELIEAVNEDYEDGDISQLTEQDVLEIADASGII